MSPERKNILENYESNSPKIVENEEEKPFHEEIKNKSKKNKESPNHVLENSNTGSNKKKSLDNSINDIHEKENQKVALPNIKGYNKNDHEYQMKIEVGNIKKEKKYNHSLEK